MGADKRTQKVNVKQRKSAQISERINQRESAGKEIDRFTQMGAEEKPENITS